MKKYSIFAKATSVLTVLMAAASSASAEITVAGSTTITNRESDFTFNFPANTADKLVIVINGEHGFNNAAGQLNSLTYDGVALTQAVYRSAQVATTDTLYHGIWYLDNPSTDTGAINVQATTRGTVSAFLLNGTADGHGATGISETNTRAISLTTTQTESMVFAAFGVGGNNNTGNTNDIDADAPMTEISAIKDPSNWQGHVVGSQTVATPGENTFSFTGGNELGGFVVAAEFLSATGTDGLPFAITDIQYAAASDEVTLTWAKTGAPSYSAKMSNDLNDDFTEVLLGGITDASDENPGDADNITRTFTLPEGFAGSLKLFFRIEEEVLVVD